MPSAVIKSAVTVIFIVVVVVVISEAVKPLTLEMKVPKHSARLRESSFWEKNR